MVRQITFCARKPQMYFAGLIALAQHVIRSEKVRSSAAFHPSEAEFTEQAMCQERTGSCRPDCGHVRKNQAWVIEEYDPDRASMFDRMLGRREKRPPLPLGSGGLKLKRRRKNSTTPRVASLQAHCIPLCRYSFFTHACRYSISASSPSTRSRPSSLSMTRSIGLPPN